MTGDPLREREEIAIHFTRKGRTLCGLHFDLVPSTNKQEKVTCVKCKAVLGAEKEIR